MKKGNKEKDADKGFKPYLILLAIIMVVVTILLVIGYKREKDIKGYTIDEDIETIKNERADVLTSISENTFNEREVYIVTDVQTLEVESCDKNDNGYSLKTHYGTINVDKWKEDNECVTVYRDLDNKYDFIGNIDKNEYISYVIDGYKRIKEDTIIIKSDLNKKKYKEFVELKEQLKELDNKEQKVIETKENIKKLQKEYLWTIVAVEILCLQIGLWVVLIYKKENK